MLTIFQIIFAAIAFAFFANGLIKFIKREQNQSFFKFITNSIIWLSIMLFALFPSFTHSLSEKLGFGESLNTFIFIGFVFIFMILFKIINIIERIEKNISEIVRKEALGKITINNQKE